MKGRSRVVLVALPLLLMGAAPPIPDWVPTADLEVSVEVMPGGSIETCRGDTERFFISSEVDAVGSWGPIPGLRHYDVGPRPATIAVTLDGQNVASTHAFYTIVPITFPEIGRHTVRISTSSLDWGLGAGDVHYSDETVHVDVVECHYIVEARGMIHLNDGGFQPVLGATIEPTRLDWVPATRSFVGSAQQINEAVAFPHDGCKATFDVKPATVHMTGFLDPASQSFHLNIVWDPGVAKTSVACPGIGGGGRSDDFTTKDYASDLPAGGIATASAPLEPWTIVTGGRSYTGLILVSLTRIHDP